MIRKFEKVSQMDKEASLLISHNMSINLFQIAFCTFFIQIKFHVSLNKSRLKETYAISSYNK